MINSIKLIIKFEMFEKFFLFFFSYKNVKLEKIINKNFFILSGLYNWLFKKKYSFYVTKQFLFNDLIMKEIY